MTKKPVILCVDDEALILNSLKAQLKDYFGQRFSYEIAERADDALALIEELREEGIQIVVIVSDWLMPGIKGDELLIRIHRKYPRVVKIMLTGQADTEAISRAEEHGGLHCCVRKPWDVDEFVKSIESGMLQL